MRDWVYQLVSPDVLVQTADEYPILRLNAASWEVMRGRRPVQLLKPAEKKSERATRGEEVSWAGVDRDLFEKLRAWRLAKAKEKGLPPYTIFHDSTLRTIARDKPRTYAGLRSIAGVGESRLASYGSEILEIIAAGES